MVNDKGDNLSRFICKLNRSHIKKKTAGNEQSHDVNVNTESVRVKNYFCLFNVASCHKQIFLLIHLPFCLHMKSHYPTRVHKNPRKILLLKIPSSRTSRAFLGKSREIREISRKITCWKSFRQFIEINSLQAQSISYPK